ncbi:MAG: hypothetical protein AAFR52_05855, partial [Pseudomonadota bacterium]
FRFQLGKALFAAGDLDEAEVALRQAAEMGHLRAWHRLGLLYAEKGQITRAETAFEKGVAEGDPAAAAGLAQLLLEERPATVDRDEAWELIAYATDFGMCDAYQAAADYYDQFAADKAWSARFEAEAEVRDVFCRRDSDRGGIVPIVERGDGGNDGGGGGY